MEYVPVLRTHGDFALVEWQGVNGPVKRWYPAKALVSSDAFGPLNHWNGSESFVICDEATGCFQVLVNNEANYEWKRVAYFKTRDIPMVDCGKRCTYSGQIEVFEDYLRMRVGSSYEVFVVREYGELCWVEPLDYSGNCLPSRGAYMDE
jgi:hypothetical protein